MTKDIFALWQYLGKRRKTQLILLFILMLITMLAEIVSIGAVIPFLSALTSPETLLQSETFSPLFHRFGIDESEKLLLPLTISFILATGIAAATRVTLLWANTKLTVAMGVELRTDLYNRTLYQPYEYHVKRNSSELISVVTEKAGEAVYYGIMQVLLLISSLLLSLSIISTLILINPVPAIATFIVLGGGYVIVGYIVRKRIKYYSHIRAESQPIAIKYLQEGIGGIRDVIMDNSQETFCQSYAKVAYQIQNAHAQNIFLGTLPKPIIEVFGIAAIALLAYWLQNNHSTNALPILGVLALGAQRLLPSLQQTYYSWSIINGSQANIKEIIKKIKEPQNPQRNQKTSPLLFENSIRLKLDHFSYSNKKNIILKKIDLIIPKGSIIGLIGETGSGKSTLLDILMGLLSPSYCELIIDDKKITSVEITRWRANIAHVPQSIFLSDTSLLENIAFGIKPEKIDFKRVQIAAKQAKISDYIETLPEKYNTFVGERGIQLSGGQRQRIGIARALYKKAEVIVLDEATSALDSETEEEVMNSIHSLNKDLTILIIAHRTSTLKNCDTIYQLNQGSLTENKNVTFNQTISSKKNKL